MTGAGVKLVRAQPADLERPAPWLDRGFEGADPKTFQPEVTAVLDQLSAAPRDPAWGAFWGVEEHVDGDRAVGLCGFKAEPDAAGTVEIAYYTFPHHEGGGRAAAMTRALCARAEADGRSVIAHTLPEESPSTSVLRRCGFRCVGLVLDPEDGDVWRWVLP